MDVLTNTRASNRYMGEIWALVCRSMAMCVRAMLLCSFIVAFVALVDVPETVQAIYSETSGRCARGVGAGEICGRGVATKRMDNAPNEDV